MAERYQSVQALLELARLQSRQKDAAGALATLAKARALAPNSEEVLSAYAQVSLAARAPVPALQVLEPLARMCPTVAQYHYMLGVALMQAGDVAGLRRARCRRPSGSSRTGRSPSSRSGLALNDRKLYAEAKPLPPPQPRASSPTTSRRWPRSRRPRRASASCRPPRRTRSGRSPGRATTRSANLVLGMVRMKQERYAEARDALQKALPRTPPRRRRQYQLSLACARLGDEARRRSTWTSTASGRGRSTSRLEEVRAQTGISTGGMKR